MASSKVEAFLTQCGKQQKTGQLVSEKEQVLLPIYLHAEVGHNRDAKEQLLWKLGDSSVVPSMVARAFCQQHIQQTQQLEREVGRVQRDLEKLIEQHKDLAVAPSVPSLVRLEVRVPLPHLELEFHDEPVWDLSAPRAACESYVAMVCNELGLGWHAHTLIMRRMKDAIDAAMQGVAAGYVQLTTLPSGVDVLNLPPRGLPKLLHMSLDTEHQPPTNAQHSSQGHPLTNPPGHVSGSPVVLDQRGEKQAHAVPNPEMRGDVRGGAAEGVAGEQQLAGLQQGQQAEQGVQQVDSDMPDFD